MDIFFFLAIWDEEWYHRKGVSEDWNSNSIWQQAKKASQGIVKNNEAKPGTLVTTCREVDWTNKEKRYYSKVLLNEGYKNLLSTSKAVYSEHKRDEQGKYFNE